MFCRISQNCEEVVFRLNFFVLTGWTSDFVLKQTKRGVPSKFGTFGPFEIGGVGDNHDSDHAECTVNTLFCQTAQRRAVKYLLRI